MKPSKSEQEEFDKLNHQYGEYIANLKSAWIADNWVRSNNVLETMNPNERKEVQNRISQWERYITPLAETWWKERGYEVIWPEDNSENMKLRKLETIAA